MASYFHNSILPVLSCIHDRQIAVPFQPVAYLPLWDGYARAAHFYNYLFHNIDLFSRS
jgi:hypothetical protein